MQAIWAPRACRGPYLGGILVPCGPFGSPGHIGDPIWGRSRHYVGHLGDIWPPQGVQGTLSGADLGVMWAITVLNWAHGTLSRARIVDLGQTLSKHRALPC